MASHLSTVVLACLRPVISCAAGWFVLVLLFRGRRLRDQALLGKAVKIDAQRLKDKQLLLRDLLDGQESFVDLSDIGVHKSHIYVAWNARLFDPEKTFRPRRVLRHKKGIVLSRDPKDVFSETSKPWGYYAPVIEVKEEAQP